MRGEGGGLIDNVCGHAHVLVITKLEVFFPFSKIFHSLKFATYRGESFKSSIRRITNNNRQSLTINTFFPA